jgi:Glyoxalase-like domain
MPIADFALVALDCPDPGALAAFYRSIVGGEIKQATATADWVRLQTPSGSDLGFQRDPAYSPPSWPDGPSQQAHLDFDVTDLDAGERAVVAVGAVKAATQPSPDEWRVFLDPAGHPFCLCLVPDHD